MRDPVAPEGEGISGKKLRLQALRAKPGSTASLQAEYSSLSELGRRVAFLALGKPAEAAGYVPSTSHPVW